MERIQKVALFVVLVEAERLRALYVATGKAEWAPMDKTKLALARSLAVQLGFPEPARGQSFDVMLAPALEELARSVLTGAEQVELAEALEQAGG